MAPSFSGVWNISTQYQYASGWPVDVNLGAIGLHAGGVTGSAYIAEVDKLTLAANSNATDFGDLSTNRQAMGSASSDTRMLVGGGFYTDGGGSDVQINIIEYFTYATASNSTDFGNLSATKYLLNGLSNNVRGIFSGGSSGGSTINVIEYVTIASTGNATDFGNLSSTYSNHGYGICASTTRGIISGFNSNVIEYITIASAGNSTDFGDMTVTRKQGHAQMASATRGVFGGGRDNSNNRLNVIDYITIASTGNATDFGDIATAKFGTMGMSSLTKGFIVGGTTASGYENVIEQITFSTTGNATDFGDLTQGKGVGNGASNGQAAFQDTAFAPAAMGLFAGGQTTSSLYHSEVEYIDIATTGTSALFGELQEKSESFDGVGSSTRAVFGNHYLRSSGSTSNIIEYFTFSAKGKSTDFGDSSQERSAYSSLSNSTRGIFNGGDTNMGQAPTTVVNTMDYITIASAGNATDFGDKTVASYYNTSSANTTRGIIAGGINSSSNRINTIEYITIASTSNATDFGDLSSTRSYIASASSSTRMVVGGGMDPSGNNENTMEYLTIASAGNATDFGDLTVARLALRAVSSSTRAVFNSGDNAAKTLDYITIASTGNATDFGDSLNEQTYSASASNSHGGIA
jgi:hypothetical protein